MRHEQHRDCSYHWGQSIQIGTGIALMLGHPLMLFLGLALTFGGFLGLPDTNGSGAGLETGGNGKSLLSR